MSRAATGRATAQPPAAGGQRRVALVTLGCGRNEVDSDQVGGALQAAGFQLVDDPQRADCVLVNTCTFIAAARQESIDTVLAACDLQAPGAAGSPKVLVIGCMAQRYGDELAAALPEVAGVVGFADYPRLPAIVDALVAGRPAPPEALPPPAASSPPRRRSLPLALGQPGTVGLALGQPGTAGLALGQAGTAAAPHGPPTAPFPVRTEPRGPWAYLKIAGGCDRGCTFCTIPSYRGRFRSRPPEEILAEARWLAANGVREVVCVSENTTSWGRDLPGGRRAQPALIDGFARVEGLRRVRLLYLQPAEVLPELLDAMAASPVVAGYYDLSLQHASAAVLRRMGRSGDAERFLELVAGIRRRDPAAVLRSSFIVGFPGETDDDVATLEAFLAEARLDWAGFFTFSPEDGTPAAAMGDQVDADEARARRDRLVEVAEAAAEERAAGFVGRTLDVLVEASDGADAVGRSYRESPETDGEVRLPAAARSAPVGHMVTARIIGADGVDLVGEPPGARAASGQPGC